MDALVDVNVLVALLHARHRHSGAAVRWLDGQRAPGLVLVCRIAQMSALRILTQPVVMKEETLSPAEFWRGWDLMMEDDRFLRIEEPKGLEAAWRGVTVAIRKGQCSETDAYLAAFARAGGWGLVTFDRGFRRFPGLRVEILI
ncbi:MAG: TA system VapC family ribonuclease toxin [Verrucomicrobiia bacterium]